MGKYNSAFVFVGKVRKLQRQQQLQQLVKKKKKLQGRAGKRIKFMRSKNKLNLKKIQSQNYQTITRKGWQKRTKKTQTIQIFIKEFIQ